MPPTACWQPRDASLSPHVPLTRLCSQAEALAYCRLHGARLLTEPEWELAAASQAAAAGEVAQLESGGWEWTSSVFGPLPGELRLGSSEGLLRMEGLSAGWACRLPAATSLHQPRPGGLSIFAPLKPTTAGCQPDSLYPGYSFDFFDGQHYVLRGASPYTHPSVARRSFRNWSAFAAWLLHALHLWAWSLGAPSCRAPLSQRISCFAPTQVPRALFSSDGQVPAGPRCSEVSGGASGRLVCFAEHWTASLKKRLNSVPAVKIGTHSSACQTAPCLLVVLF